MPSGWLWLCTLLMLHVSFSSCCCLRGVHFCCSSLLSSSPFCLVFCFVLCPPLRGFGPAVCFVCSAAVGVGGWVVRLCGASAHLSPSLLELSKGGWVSRGGGCSCSPSRSSLSGGLLVSPAFAPPENDWARCRSSLNLPNLRTRSKVEVRNEV